MRTCFVIQPFDDGPFDRRYEDVIAPAIADAGLKPYRVDRDLSASIPIEQIETEIRRSAVCLADISDNNPNVWFELGFAIAAGKGVALVCNNSRERFPFDVQHRQVIKYSTQSPSDFARLRQNIASRLRALASKAEELEVAESQSAVAEVGGLSTHEFLTLVGIAQGLDSPGGEISAYFVREECKKMGCTPIAVTLALKGLTRKGLISARNRVDEPEQGYYVVYSVTDQGFSWLEANEHRLVLRREEPGTDYDGVPF